MKSPQPSPEPKPRDGPHLDLAGAKAIVKAYELLGVEMKGEDPMLDLSMYATLAYNALDYLDEQFGQFNVLQALFRNTPFPQPGLATSEAEQ